jgi:hypothetical protein
MPDVFEAGDLPGGREGDQVEKAVVVPVDDRQFADAGGGGRELRAGGDIFEHEIAPIPPELHPLGGAEGEIEVAILVEIDQCGGGEVAECRERFGLGDHHQLATAPLLQFVLEDQQARRSRENEVGVGGATDAGVSRGEWFGGPRLFFGRFIAIEVGDEQAGELAGERMFEQGPPARVALGEDLQRLFGQDQQVETSVAVDVGEASLARGGSFFDGANCGTASGGRGIAGDSTAVWKSRAM